jgi:hypothetical protein
MPDSPKSQFVDNLFSSEGASLGVRVPRRQRTTVEVWLKPPILDHHVPKAHLTPDEALRVAMWLIQAAATSLGLQSDLPAE